MRSLVAKRPGSIATLRIRPDRRRIRAGAAANGRPRPRAVRAGPPGASGAPPGSAVNAFPVCASTSWPNASICPSAASRRASSPRRRSSPSPATVAQRLSTVTVTATVAVYSVVPPSLSRIGPRTASGPVSVVVGTWPSATTTRPVAGPAVERVREARGDVGGRRVRRRRSATSVNGSSAEHARRRGERRRRRDVRRWSPSCSDARSRRRVTVTCTLHVRARAVDRRRRERRRRTGRLERAVAVEIPARRSAAAARVAARSR